MTRSDPSRRFAATLVVGAALFAATFAVHATQQRDRERVAGLVQQVDAARIDLAEGYARLAASNNGFDRDQAAHLLRQGLHDALRASDAPALVDAAAALSRAVDAQRPPDAELELAYAAASHAIDRSRTDLQEAHEQLVRRQDAAFTASVGLGLGLAIIALALVNGVGLAASRFEVESRRLSDLVGALLEGNDDVAFLTAPDGRFLLVNDAALRAFGMPRERVLDSSDRIVFGERAPAARRVVDEVVRTGRSARHELQLADGRVYDTTRVLVRAADGGVLGVLGFGRDVTERIRAQRAHEAQLARLHSLAQAFPGALFTLQLAGTRWSFTYVSARIEGLLGVSPEQLLASAGAARRHVVDEDLEATRVAVEATLQTGAPLHCTFRVDHPTRGRLHLDAHAVTLRLARDTLVWHGFVSDVSERVRLEDKVHQTLKLEAIGRLAGGVAHDFNNLLTVIQAYVDMLLGDEAADDSERREFLHQIQMASERAAGLTAQLLAFGRRTPANPTTIEATSHVERAAQWIERLIGEDITLTVQVAAAPLHVHVDPNQFDQVLMNLVVNARDAMPAGGRIDVAVAALDLEPTAARGLGLAAGAWIHVTVADTGCGMPANVVERAFEPFFTTKEASKGTGLGLAVTHGIVAASGGQVTIDSTPGRGTIVHVYLPSRDASVTPKAAATRTPLAAGDRHVLLVEDDGPVRQLARRALEQAGYRVTVADDGIAALGMDVRPDALISDVVMPRLGGTELAARLRARQPGLPVLFVTGYTPDALAGQGPGDHSVLSKPFTPRQLVDAVTLLLAQPPAAGERDNLAAPSA